MRNSIKKKPFDNLNLKTIRKEASAVCDVYNQLSPIKLGEKELLNSFAKSFGYKSWEQIVSVNKSRRYYLPFSFYIRCHVVAIINHLMMELQNKLNLPIPASGAPDISWSKHQRKPLFFQTPGRCPWGGFEKTMSCSKNQWPQKQISKPTTRP